MGQIVKTFLVFASLFFAVNAPAAELVFEADVQIKKNDQNNFESIKAGQSLPLQAGDNVFVLSSQNLPLLVVAPSKNNSKVVVSDTNMTAALQEHLQPAVQRATVEIIDGLRKAEALIQKKDYTQASTIIVTLKSKYKDISSLLFMSGTISFLMNNKSAAVEDLQKGLILDPANEPAKRLLAQMKGAP
jgi:hypothetical protein